ncbi:MAG TPA: hypothetical protein VF812_12460 [Ktedonobacterales bacterium]
MQAESAAPPRTLRTDQASLGLLRVLDLLDTPAQIVSDLAYGAWSLSHEVVTECCRTVACHDTSISNHT